MKRVVLGVSGSVAAYRAADLARDLMRAGCEVRVCLTDAAQKFVQAALFEALTGQPCLQDVFEEPVRGRMAHIDWARQADLILIAPATANTLSKLAHGEGEDMLTTLALAATGPIVVAPAMNPAMYTHAATQSSMETLKSRGVHFVEPVEGDVACGENGQGKLASNAHIVEESLRIIHRAEVLKGQTVLITSGPTEEPIDDVRFLTNRSSGKMGMAVARAAKLMGADVVLISGPTSLPTPTDFRVIPVRTAEEMRSAALGEIRHAQLVIGVAAVADYRPAQRIRGKLRRSDEEWALKLVPNPDIIAELAQAHPEKKVVAFAAEPTSDPEVARAKMLRKGVHAIAMNDVSRPDIGFGADENELKLLFSDGKSAESGKQSKLGCALWLLEKLTEA